MQQKITFPSDVPEATADFTKSFSIADKKFLKAKKAYETSSAEKLPRAFLDYCKVIMSLKDDNTLTVREAAYLIGKCDRVNSADTRALKEITESAERLQRHPNNYKADHYKGWAALVKKIESAS